MKVLPIRNLVGFDSRRFAVICSGVMFLVAASSIKAQPCEPHWDATIGQPGFNNEVHALTVFNDQIAAAVHGNGVSTWDGVSWQSLGDLFVVLSLTTYDGDLIAGLGDQTTSGVRRWTGSHWEVLGEGLCAPIRAMIVYNGELIAGGSFGVGCAQSPSSIARWSGSSWQPIGSGLQGSAVRALAVYDGELVASGSFATAGGQMVSNIARWNGSSWQPLGGGVNGEVRCLTVYNGELVAGGTFTAADGRTANRIARWDGTSWHQLGSGVSLGVFALRVYNNELFAGGSFSLAGGQTARRIARWNGSIWQPVAGGVAGGTGADFVKDMVIHEGRLVVGGHFWVAGTESAHYIAEWNGCLLYQPPPVCEQFICPSKPNYAEESFCPDFGLESGKDYLVFITHGWQRDGTAPGGNNFIKMQAIADDIRVRIEDNPALDDDAWQVKAFDWEEPATTGSILRTIFLGGVYILTEATSPPYEAREAAVAIGKKLAEEIELHNYEYVHLIAHSAGGGMISEAARLLAGSGTKIMCTFLDEFSNGNINVGQAWADNYFAQDASLLFTQGPLLQAYDVNVTFIDPNVDPCSLGGWLTLSSHGWPVDFYRNTINNPAWEETGFPLSMEGGNFYLDGNNEPQWNINALPPISPSLITERVLGAAPPCIDEFDEWSYAVTTPAFNFPSPECSPVIGPPPILSIALENCETNLAGTLPSPSWINLQIEFPENVSSIQLDALFESSVSAEGILSLYLDGSFLAPLDERYTSGAQRMFVGVPANTSAGPDILGVRLDSHSTLPSAISLSHFTFDISHAGPACAADIAPFGKTNGSVDVDDLIAVILSWGPCGNVCLADVDASGVVDVDDLIAIILNWGACS